MRNQVDTIILDLGGVLIDVDYSRTAREFEQLGHTDFDGLYGKAEQDSLFDDFETGKLNAKGFCERVRELVSPALTDLQILNAWNAMLGSIPDERIELVEELKSKYKVLLLSNTNAIHVPAFERIVREENHVSDFRELFHGACYSCEIGLRKPDKEIFDHVLEKHGAERERTLFIDDSIQHVEGALSAGLQAVHLDLEMHTICSLVRELRLI